MEAIFPLAKLVPWSDAAEVASAVVLGMGFGFVLEKGGLGNAQVLAGQWFGYNFAVLRVMFTAIVVAMLGLFGLHYLGVVNLELVYINGTYLWPQLVGGLIFGVGFGVGQHCPGTAVVGCATGNFDAMSYVGGFLAGAALFAFAQPLFNEFYESSNHGRWLLSEAFGLPIGIVVFAVTVMAVGAFAATHVLDRKLGQTRGAP